MKQFHSLSFSLLSAMILLITSLNFHAGAQGLVPWYLSGNSGTDPASHYIGTSDATPLSISTNGTCRIYIDSTGDVTLGSDGNYIQTNGEENVISIYTGGVRTGYFDPTTIEYSGAAVVRLGDVDFLGNGMQLSLNEEEFGSNNCVFRSVGYNAIGVMKLLRASDSTEFTLVNKNFQFTPDLAHGMGQIWDSAGHGFKIYSPTDDSLIIGLPFKYVIGGSGAGKVLTSDAQGLASWQPATNSTWGLNGNTETNDSSVIGTLSNNDLVFKTNSIARMRILKTGAVGIGSDTVPAGYKLAVNGKILCEEVKIMPHGNWPDFVFNKDYKLMSLNDLDKFVLENKHLPDMPTSETVSREGTDLGEIQKKLLQKVEELSVYLLQQNKKIEQLEKKVSDLSAHK